MTEAEKEAAKLKVSNEYQAKVDALNAGRTGVGPRAAYGFTRGKGSIPFVYERFDESMPDTLPKTVQDFLTVTKSSPDDLIKFVISGYNDKLYTEASDPIAEFVNQTWDDETKTRFRLVVRNYAAAVGGSIEDAVKLMLPGFDAAAAKAKA